MPATSWGFVIWSASASILLFSTITDTFEKVRYNIHQRDRVYAWFDFELVHQPIDYEACFSSAYDGDYTDHFNAPKELCHTMLLHLWLPGTLCFVAGQYKHPLHND